MRFNGRNLFVLVFVLALVTLSCSIGVLKPSDPAFIAPVGIPTQTPALPSETPTAAATPTVPPTPLPTVAEPTETQTPIPLPPILYDVQAGDTLPVVAVRFGVQPDEIASNMPISATALLPPHQLLIIPNRLANTTSPQKILPDSEVVFSPSAVDFDVNAFVKDAGGYLSTYKEYLNSTAWTTGADIVKRVALENSINPRLLLSLLEYQSHWVYGQPADMVQADYPMGKLELARKGLFAQLVWTVNQISVGYYGWREGRNTEIQFSDGVTARLAPDLNAGTVALQYYLVQVYDTNNWVRALDPVSGIPALHERMFGNPWLRAQQVEPLYPPDLRQPPLTLPFMLGQMWSFSGGPHGAWEHDGARAALDFAPGSDEAGCEANTYGWAVAAAPGIIARVGVGVIVLDLDGDGNEQTGWNLLYLHIATKGRQVKVGDWVETGDLLGQPSCEGGLATGPHIHLARKYNGEWIPADGPMPFVLDGWTAHAGPNAYEGTLTRDGVTIPASIYGSFESRIVRDRQPSGKVPGP